MKGIKVSLIITIMFLASEVFAANWEKCVKLMPTITGHISGMTMDLHDKKLITDAELEQVNTEFQQAKNCDQGIAIYLEFIYSKLTDVE